MTLWMLGWALIIAGLMIMLTDLGLREKRSIPDTLFIMQFLLPEKPLGRIGNATVILGAILLIVSTYFPS